MAPNPAVPKSSAENILTGLSAMYIESFVEKYFGLRFISEHMEDGV